MNTIKTFWANLREAFSPEENPFLAQERWGRRARGPLPLWEGLRLTLLLVAPLALVVALMLPRQIQTGLWLASLVSIVHIPLILLTVALHGGRVFSREEQQGTLDLLLMVPTRRPWLVWHKLAGPIRTGCRVATYGLPLYVLSWFLGGVSLWTLLMLAGVCFLAALPVAGPWTFTLLYPGERGDATSRRMPSLTETFWLTCFVLLAVFILGCAVVGGLEAVEQSQRIAVQPYDQQFQRLQDYQQVPVSSSEPESVFANYLPLTVFVGLADAMGSQHPFFHGRLWLLPPVLLLLIGMMLNRVLAAAARMHVAAAGEGRLRRWRTALSMGITAGWLLLVLGYAWLPIEKGAIAYLSAPLPELASSVREVPVVPKNLIVRFNLDNVRIQTAAVKDDSNRLQVQQEISEMRVMRQRLLEGIKARELHHKIQSLAALQAGSSSLRIMLEQALLDAVNAREVRRHAMTGLLLMLFTLTAVVGSLLLIVSGPWREHLETLYRRGAEGKTLFREVARRSSVILMAPVALFLLVCLSGSFGPWQISLANWAQYGLLTAVTLLLCGTFGLWWTVAEANDPSGRKVRGLMGLFLAAVLLWPVPMILTKSPAAHTAALTSPFVSFALQYHPANEGLARRYGWVPYSNLRALPGNGTPVPDYKQQSGEETVPPPVAPWWMALVLQGALAGLFLGATRKLSRYAPHTLDARDAGTATEPGWFQRQWERCLSRLPGWLDNPIALKEWRLMARQADLIVIAMLVLGISGALAYAALRNQMPNFWFLFDHFIRNNPDLLDRHFPWCSALLCFLPFIAGLLFMLGPVSLGGTLAKEREGGTWPFVLVTPLSDGAIMRGKLLGLMASSLVLVATALPGLLLFAGGSSWELWGEGAWAPWLLLGIGVTWFLSLAFVGSAAGLFAACRYRSASTAQLMALFWTYLVSLARLCSLPLLALGPVPWIAWHILGLGVEIIAAGSFYEAARSHCHWVRSEDIQFEEEVRPVGEEG